MMVCDARWLQEVLGKFPNEEISPLVNLGSSTKKFRQEEQSYIHEFIFRPLEERGVEVIHSDLKEDEGVDIAGNIFDDKTFQAMKASHPKSVICTHMFEHVEDREELARRLIDLLPDSGLFFVTVPYSYHQHDDPIDTMYRPTPDELAEVFGGQKIFEKRVLADGTYWDKIKQRPVTLFFRHFFRFFLPFLGLAKWKRSMKKLYWLFHRYKVSAVAGRKVEQ